MDQFEKRHYAFMREWRGEGGERLPLRHDISFRPEEPAASRGDYFVLAGAVAVFLIWVLLT